MGTQISLFFDLLQHILEQAGTLYEMFLVTFECMMDLLN